MQPKFSLSFIDHPFWGRGFRPFFLLGAIYSVMTVIIWAGFFAGHFNPPAIFADPVLWHAHEMIYGFVMTIVAGFLLTAVANWTGGAPVRQIQLIMLCVLWLTGRLAMNISGLPVWLVVAAETIFIPALAISLALPLLRSWNVRNFVFLGMLTGLFACDVAFMITHDRTPLHLALFIIMMMISLTGGRIIPSFTVAALRRKGEMVSIQDQLRLDQAAVSSLVLLGAMLIFAGSESVLFAATALLAAVLHLVRMLRYHTLRTLRDPMLWILHAGYGWLVIGLFMTALAGMGFVTLTSALHAMTVGSIGSLTLGMMCRVTLGHTGRSLASGPVTVFSFVLLQIATLLRVFGPLFAPEYYVDWITATAALWAVCFALYLPIYAPMLWRPRPDGEAP